MKITTKKMLLIVLVSVLTCSQISLAGYIGDLGTVMRLGKFSISPYSYIIEPFNSTHVQSVNASGYVYQSTSGSNIINNAWGNMSTTGGRVFCKGGIYQINMVLTLSYSASSLHFTLEGEGSSATVFNVTSSKFIDADTTAWSQYPQLTLRGFSVHHYVSQASDVTFDLMYVCADLDDIVSSEEPGRIATCYKIGPTGNGGKGLTWNSVDACDYAVGFDLSIDHLMMLKPYVITCSSIGFNIHDCEWTTLVGPEVWWGANALNDTLRPFFMGHVGKDVRMYNVAVEGGEAYPLAWAIFARNTSASFWNYFEVFGLDGYPSGMILDNASSRSYPNVHSWTGNYITEARGSNTTAADAGLQAHGLCAPPDFVSVTSKNTTLTFTGANTFTSTTFNYLLKNTSVLSATGQTLVWHAWTDGTG